MRELAGIMKPTITYIKVTAGKTVVAFKELVGEEGVDKILKESQSPPHPDLIDAKNALVPHAKAILSMAANALLSVSGISLVDADKENPGLTISCTYTGPDGQVAGISTPRIYMVDGNYKGYKGAVAPIEGETSEQHEMRRPFYGKDDLARIVDTLILETHLYLGGKTSQPSLFDQPKDDPKESEADGFEPNEGQKPFKMEAVIDEEEEGDDYNISGSNAGASTFTGDTPPVTMPEGSAGKVTKGKTPKTKAG